MSWGEGAEIIVPEVKLFALHATDPVSITGIIYDPQAQTGVAPDMESGITT